MVAKLPDEQRIVITGVGLTAPNGDSLPEFRQNLLEGKSGIVDYEIRYFGKTVAGVCNYDPLKYQRRKEVRRGTRAGSIGIYSTAEAVADAGLDWANIDTSRVGVYVGVTEHGNVETENEIYLLKGYDYDTQYWSHHHNPRTVANNPAGEISLNLGITGPCYTLGAACAAGNAGLIQGVQMLRLGECDVALAGGVSESIHTFGIFASFHSQGALARHDDPAGRCAAQDSPRASAVRFPPGGSAGHGGRPHGSRTGCGLWSRRAAPDRAPAPGQETTRRSGIPRGKKDRNGGRIGGRLAGY